MTSATAAFFAQSPSATGVILAGGLSSRLGRDKAVEDIGGVPMLQRVAQALNDACTEIIVVGEPAEEREQRLTLPSGTRWVSDLRPGRGPLGGLHTGLLAARQDLVVAVGCDMPFLNPLLLTSLLQVAQNGPDYQAVVPRIEGKLQPLHAVYRRSVALQAEELLRVDQNASLNALVTRLIVFFVEEGPLIDIDHDLRSFLSVNTEDDVAKARQVVGQWPSRS